MKPYWGCLVLGLVSIFTEYASTSHLLSVRVSAEPVTKDRVATMTSPERERWLNYVERSSYWAQIDSQALQKEIASLGWEKAIRAPDGGDFKISAKVGDPWFASSEAMQLCDTIRSFQTPSGGWSKHTGYRSGPRQKGMQWTSQHEPGSKTHYLATFDNRSTTEQLQFLARVWYATKSDDCAHAFEQGLRFVLDAQYPNGGWPQVYPLEGGYHDDITLNDDAMTNILILLKGIADRQPEFAFVDDALRLKSKKAIDNALKVLRAMQVSQKGVLTVWCAQHDAITLAPSAARKMEPPTLSSLESARMLRFLMSLPNPSPVVVESIEAGLAWLEATKISGIRRIQKEGKTEFITDLESTEVYWARFYDLHTNRPVFPGRNGVIYDSFAKMAAENQLGYDFMTTLPASILKNGQKKWRGSLSKKSP